jgi:GWxTD domain-containing protein
MRHTTLLAITIVLTLAAAAQAEPPTRYADWPNGPVKWLMTAEDKEAWRAINNDAAAREFIALFWARRDPTPGTAENEFRDEFDHRVAIADIVFSRDTRLRGALTDPGRVYILLGQPKSISLPAFAAASAPSSGTTHGVGSVPQSIGTFYYTNPRALHLADGLLRFVSLGGAYVLSPLGNSYGALLDASNRAIVNPALRAVPSWAATAPAWQRFQVTLLHASSERARERVEILPADVTKAVDDVRALLPWKTYQFADGVTFSARDAQPATATMLAQAGKPYRVVLRFTDAGASLNISPFQVSREGNEILSTTFAIKPGETVSVGASRGGEAKEALLFFVTWLAD